MADIPFLPWTNDNGLVCGRDGDVPSFDIFDAANWPVDDPRVFDIAALIAAAPETAAERDRLKAVNAQLVGALGFYAIAWNTHPGDSGPGGNDPQDPVCDPDYALLEDCGQIARATLAKATAAQEHEHA
jgi:hypothetical protein